MPKFRFLNRWLYFFSCISFKTFSFFLLEHFSADFSFRGRRNKRCLSAVGLGELDAKDQDFGKGVPDLPGRKVQHAKDQSVSEFFRRVAGESSDAGFDPELPKINFQFIGFFRSGRFFFDMENASEADVEFVECFFF